MKVIEVDDEESFRSVWMKEIYKLRAMMTPDKEIVRQVNLMGFKTKGMMRKGVWIEPQQLTVKYLQSLVCRPVYAGVQKEKWTGNKPVRIPYVYPYKSLVDIDTWNKANK